ncbi:TPA: dihydrofolate reductase [Clostridioides difficile]|nr:dihydrofolate reductase [Clostridioides difficile]HBE9347793.1 dihydrofolate reductase [Clostridioides difficile]HBE9824733.1 dihydrofolate reductase [Clostridioides difficile]HBE9828837.1 dihydrofolate reductase [Clostridioides difficile]HBF0918966.1 dihydrofolate reductase [Clostridioides difficile]
MLEVVNMRKVVLYIATSLDGYIAEENGSVSFLDEISSAFKNEQEDDYNTFYDTIDTIIMGNSTYVQIANELSPNEWYYKGKECYVYSNTINEVTENVKYTNLEPKKLIEQIGKDKEKKDIWIVGGGDIVKLFMKDNLIDDYYIYILPIILGRGISLFKSGIDKTNLNFKKASNIGELVKLEYSKKQK